MVLRLVFAKISEQFPHRFSNQKSMSGSIFHTVVCGSLPKMPPHENLTQNLRKNPEPKPANPLGNHTLRKIFPKIHEPNPANTLGNQTLGNPFLGVRRSHAKRSQLINSARLQVGWAGPHKKDYKIILGGGLHPPPFKFIITTATIRP